MNSNQVFTQTPTHSISRWIASVAPAGAACKRAMNEVRRLHGERRASDDMF